MGIYRGKYEWANENSPVGGDCSLWVRAATLQLDDGQWQCQVTASNYDVQVLTQSGCEIRTQVPTEVFRSNITRTIMFYDVIRLRTKERLKRRILRMKKKLTKNCY